jgi:hypothetical protein
MANNGMVDIKGLSKAAVLAALHNGTRALGMGLLHDIGRPMTEEEAQEYIDADNGSLSFDYVLGRPLKVNISGDEFRSGLYDRDAGEGRAAEVIKALRESRPAESFSMPEHQRGL